MHIFTYPKDDFEVTFNVFGPDVEQSELGPHFCNRFFQIIAADD